jgi:outer membrane protein assembly factor BamB
MVYVYDAGMRLYCFDAQTGSPVWRQDITADFQGRKIIWASAASPVIVDDKVIVCGGGEGQSFLAFDKKTGQLRWQAGDEKPTHATPTVATLGGQKQVIFFMQSGPIAINPEDGSEIWRTKFEFRVSTAASPVVDDNRVYVSAGYGVGALVLEVNSEKQTKDGWETTDLWYQKGKLMNHWSTPVVHEGHLYGLYGVKKYGSAPLQCVDLSTGKIKWRQRGFGQGNCILIDDKLVVLSDAGELAIVEATPDAYNEITRATVIEGKCWSMPAYSNGRLYIRSTAEAACIKL